jgi:hypothetical protein
MVLMMAEHIFQKRLHPQFWTLAWERIVPVNHVGHYCKNILSGIIVKHCQNSLG